MQFAGTDKRSLGIFQPSDVLIDDITTFQEGVQDVLIYNANESGPVFFTINFTGAVSLMATFASTAAVVAATLLIN